MADPLLNFARLLFGFPFGFQIAVARDLSDLLFDCPLPFWKLSLDFFFRAVFIFLLRPRKARIAALLRLCEDCHFCKSRSFLRSRSEERRVGKECRSRWS